MPNHTGEIILIGGTVSRVAAYDSGGFVFMTTNVDTNLTISGLHIDWISVVGPQSKTKNLTDVALTAFNTQRNVAGRIRLTKEIDPAQTRYAAVALELTVSI